MQVAIVHDDLVQLGGAERVLRGLCEIYPDAPIFTSVFDSKNKELKRFFGDKKIVTSFLQNIPLWKRFYKLLLPLYPIAFEQFDLTKFDLVISHTTRFAKSVITKPKTLHISYIHTPPRFLWHFSQNKNFGVLENFLSKLRIYDQISSRRPDYLLAGSENSKKRIKKTYKRESVVVYPFIDLDRFKNIKTFNGDYFVVIGRLNEYKRFDLAIKACQVLGINLKVIGDGKYADRLKSLVGNSDGLIEFFGNIDDNILVRILSGCKALILPGEEDFGLTPLEAQALGKPVIAFKKGGSLETVIDGKTGVFFQEQSVKSLMNAIKILDNVEINPDDCIKNAEKFSKDNFIISFKKAIDSESLKVYNK